MQYKYCGPFGLLLSISDSPKTYTMYISLECRGRGEGGGEGGALRGHIARNKVVEFCLSL